MSACSRREIGEIEVAVGVDEHGAVNSETTAKGKRVGSSGTVGARRDAHADFNCSAAKAIEDF